MGHVRLQGLHEIAVCFDGTSTNGADAKCLRSTSESEYSKVYCITGLCMSIHRSSVSHVRYAEL